MFLLAEPRSGHVGIPERPGLLHLGAAHLCQALVLHPHSSHISLIKSLDWLPFCRKCQGHSVDNQLKPALGKFAGQTAQLPQQINSEEKKGKEGETDMESLKRYQDFVVFF